MLCEPIFSMLLTIWGTARRSWLLAKHNVSAQELRAIELAASGDAPPCLRGNVADIVKRARVAAGQPCGPTEKVGLYGRNR
jgi:hypothetical protein